MPLNFDLNPDPSIISPEPGVLKSRNDDVYPTTTKINDSFTGTLDFEFSSGVNECVDWGSSYFEFQIDFHDTSNAVLAGPTLSTSGQYLAPALMPAFNAVGAMFSQFQMFVNTTPVTSVTNYQQIDTFNKRTQTTKEQSKCWGTCSLLDRDDIQRTLNSGFCNVSGVVSSAYRYAGVLSGAQQNTVIYQPSVGFFANETTSIGQQNYRLSFTIDTNYKRLAVQASTALTPAASITTYSSYNWIVKEVIFHPCIVTTDRPPQSGDHYTLMSAWSAQQVSVAGATSQLTYYVEPSSYCLSYFEQTGNVGTDTTYSGTKFTCSGVEVYQSRAPRILYAGQQFPTIDKTITINVSGTGATNNQLTGLQQIYIWYCNTFGYNANNTDGNESFADWLNMGVIWAYRFDKSLGDRNTQVQVNIAHDTTRYGTSTNILGWLVSQSDKMIKYTYQNGVVVSVQVESA